MQAVQGSWRLWAWHQQYLPLNFLFPSLPHRWEGKAASWRIMSSLVGATPPLRKEKHLSLRMWCWHVWDDEKCIWFPSLVPGTELLKPLYFVGWWEYLLLFTFTSEFTLMRWLRERHPCTSSGGGWSLERPSEYCPGGPVVESPSSNEGLTPCWGTRIPHVAEQLNWLTAAREKCPPQRRSCMTQLRPDVAKWINTEKKKDQVIYRIGTFISIPQFKGRDWGLQNKFHKNSQTRFDELVNIPLARRAVDPKPMGIEALELRTLPDIIPWNSSLGCSSVSFVISFLFIYFQSSLEARGILVPWPGMEPASSVLEVRSPNHWATREVPMIFFLING